MKESLSRKRTTDKKGMEKKMKTKIPKVVALILIGGEEKI
jgi:hypothetical protein